jgi:hypothetical protein
VLDQYLSFISPSPQLFSLVPPPPPPAPASGPPQPGPSTAPTSYHILNSPQTTEQEIEAEIERIANGLFSVVVTSGKRAQISEICIHLSAFLQVSCLLSVARKGMRQRWSRGNSNRKFGMLSSPLRVRMLPQPCLPTILPDCPISSDLVRMNSSNFTIVPASTLQRRSTPHLGP